MGATDRAGSFNFFVVDGRYQHLVKEDRAMLKSVSLFEAFGKVPDPRGAQGRRHPLPAILTLAAVAMLSGARSLYAIAQFGRDRGQSFAR
ncbi:MAG: transposase family protein, partial [Planctomycetes bacterium]|nr:transposase family protein [Planctomycetota bacterium]